MPKKILIVTKDIGEFNVYEPVVKQLLREERCAVMIIAEGLSEQKWKDAGLMVIGGAEVVSDVASIFTSHHPDLVLTGLGAPINLGERFGIAANVHGVKLGYVHDLWGVYKRSSAIPQFICVTDEFDAKLVREYAPYTHASLGNPHDHLVSDRTPKVYVTGSPAMDALASVEPDGKLEYMLHGMPSPPRSILLLGQDESTTPVLEHLAKALEMEEHANSFVVIPRLHGKFMNNEVLRHRWLDILYGMKKSKVLFVEEKVPIRKLMRSAVITLSTYSTGLIEAAMLGSCAVSSVSEIGRKKMAEALGVTKFPLVEMDCAKEVSSPEELASILRDPFQLDEFVRNAQSSLKSDGKATERVVNVILEELG